MEENLFEQRIDINTLNNAVINIRNEISKVIVGQHKMVDFLLIALLCDGHVLIEGVPGVAKTLTAKLLAKIINTNFSRIQFTPDLMPSDVLGTSVFNPKEAEFEFKRGPIFSNIILIDEINRAPAKTQSALFEVMEERQVTIDGITILWISLSWLLPLKILLNRKVLIACLKHNWIDFYSRSLSVILP